MHALFGSSPWFMAKGPESDVVISSRVRLARNLAGHKFTSRMDKIEETLVRETVFCAAKSIEEAESTAVYTIQDFDSVGRRVLIDRSVFSQAYSVDPERKFVCSADCSFSLLGNETDHVRFQKLVPGLDLATALCRVRDADLILEKTLDYAVRIDSGYITQNLFDSGTGMKAQVLLHIPALSDTGLSEKALKGVMEEGMTVTGLSGEGDSFPGAFFFVSNQTALGLSEDGIAGAVTEISTKLAKYERLAREELMDKKRDNMMDSVARAYGMARYARILSWVEAVDIISRLRLGVALGLVKGAGLDNIDALLYGLKTSHLELRSGAVKLRDGVAADAFRADILRNALSQTLFSEGGA